MADYSMPGGLPLGASFLPGADSADPRKRQFQGEALRQLAMILPGTLGPSAIAPDILLQSQGLGAVAPGASPMASLIADAIVRQITGEGGMGPAGLVAQQVAPPSPLPTPPVGPAQSLTQPGSLSGVVRREAQQPSGRVAAGALPQAPGATTGMQPGLTPAQPPVTTQGPTLPPAIHFQQAGAPTPGAEGQGGGRTDVTPAAPQTPYDLGATLNWLRTMLGRQTARSPFMD